MMVLVLTIAAQAERIDSTQFVAFYNYTIQTQDEEGLNVTDSLRLAMLVGTRATYCTTVLAYNKDGRPGPEMTNAFSMHQQNVLTDVERSEVVAVEPIYPYRYETHEPMAKIDWTLTDDTLTISGLLCHRATGKLYGKQWTVYYTEEIPSSAGPWRLRGLPGLIIKAENEAHTFCLAELRQNHTSITAPEKSPNVQRMTYAKLLKHHSDVFGNRQYAKNPLFHVPNLNGGTLSLGGSIHHMTVINLGSQQFAYADGFPLLTKAHVYQPLEIE